MQTFSLAKRERNAGCTLHPRVSARKIVRRTAHEHTGSAEHTPASPARFPTTYAALSPATNSSCHRRRRIKADQARFQLTSPPLDLAPATGVGTTRFCRTQPTSFVLRAGCSLTGNPPCDHLARRRCRVHRIPSRVRDDARSAPLAGKGRGELVDTDLPDGESDIFLLIGLDDPDQIEMSRKIRLHAHRIFNSWTALGRGPKIQRSEPTSDLERIPDQVRTSREIRRVPNFGSERTHSNVSSERG